MFRKSGNIFSFFKKRSFSIMIISYLHHLSKILHVKDIFTKTLSNFKWNTQEYLKPLLKEDFSDFFVLCFVFPSLNSTSSARVIEDNVCVYSPVSFYFVKYLNCFTNEVDFFFETTIYSGSKIQLADWRASLLRKHSSTSWKGIAIFLSLSVFLTSGSVFGWRK